MWILLPVCLVLLGAGCVNEEQANLIKEQQKQIDQLRALVEKQTTSTPGTENVTNKQKNPSQIPVTTKPVITPIKVETQVVEKIVEKPIYIEKTVEVEKEDGALKIERCKATAKIQKGAINSYIEYCNATVKSYRESGKFNSLLESDWTDFWNKCVETEIKKFQEEYYSYCLNR